MYDMYVDVHICTYIHMHAYVLLNVVCVTSLGFTLCVNLNNIMKFIYISCKCLISIYIHVSVNVED